MACSGSPKLPDPADARVLRRETKMKLEAETGGRDAR